MIKRNSGSLVLDVAVDAGFLNDLSSLGAKAPTSEILGHDAAMGVSYLTVFSI